MIDKDSDMTQAEYDKDRDMTQADDDFHSNDSCNNDVHNNDSFNTKVGKSRKSVGQTYDGGDVGRRRNKLPWEIFIIRKMMSFMQKRRTRKENLKKKWKKKRRKP